MTVRKLAAIAVAAFIWLVPMDTPASAQGVNFGVQGSYSDDFDFGIGGRVEVAIPQQEAIRAVGSFDYFFAPDPFTYWEANANGLYAFDLPNAPKVLPYVGGGLNIARIESEVTILGTTTESSTTEVGLNLIGGAQFPLEAITPFGELKIELSGGEQFILTGGILF